MTNNLNMADTLMVTAECIIKMAKMAKIDLKLTDVYNKETVTNLALIANFMVQVINKSGKEQLKITKE